MFTLEELDQEAVKAESDGFNYLCRYFERQKEEEAENRAIKENNCPRCPGKLVRTTSCSGSGVVFYSCDADPKNNHIFIRYPNNDPRRA